MIYKTKDGRQVFDKGTVIIEGISHYVENGFVKCNHSLNHKSWNTTKKKGVCPVCFPETNFIQQSLF